MTKEKTQGDELSVIGKQTVARAYSAMGYYFDALSIGSVWRAGQRPKRGLYQGGRQVKGKPP